jgi:hypothetical protein
MVLEVWTSTYVANRHKSRSISARDMAIMARKYQDVHTLFYNDSQCLKDGASIGTA